MPITSINGLYNGFLVKYTDEHLEELLSLSNFKDQGGVISTKYIYFPSPQKLQEYGIDHSNRPYRVFLYENDLIIPEYFSFDLIKWYGTFNHLIDRNKVKAVMLQGLVRTYELLKNGSFFIIPSLDPAQHKAITVQFNGHQINGENIYPHLRYQVETQTFKADGINSIGGTGNTSNKSVDLGWRVILENKYDISVLMCIDALEKGISFKAMVSDAKTKRFITTRETFDHKAHVYHILSKN